MDILFRDFEKLSDEEVLDWANEIFTNRGGLSDSECVALLRKMMKSTEEQFFKEESNE